MPHHKTLLEIPNSKMLMCIILRRLIPLVCYFITYCPLLLEAADVSECTTITGKEIPEGLCVMDGLGGLSKSCYKFKQASLISLTSSLSSESSECLVGSRFDAIRSSLRLDEVPKRTFIPTIEINDWSSSAIESSVFRILLEEMLGYRDLRVLYRPDKTSFQLRAKDFVCQAINLELWQHIPHSESQIITQPLGVIGREGLYVPKSTPILSSHFQFLQENDNLTSLAQSPSTSSNSKASSPYDVFPPSGDFNLTALYGDPENYACNSHTPSTVGWTESICANGSWIPPQCAEIEECKELYLDHPTNSLGWFEGMVKNLGLKFRVVYLGMQGLTRRVQEAHAQELKSVGGLEDGKGIVYYWWDPHPLHSQYPSSRFIIPEFSDQCNNTYSAEPMDSGVDCDREARSLLKALPAGLKQSQPDLYALWNSFTLDNKEQMAMMMLEGPWMGGSGNLTVEEAACEWLRTTKVDWSQWLSVTVPNTDFVSEADCDTTGFSRLEIVLLIFSVFLSAAIFTGGLLFMRRHCLGGKMKTAATEECDQANELNPFQYFESPFETGVTILSNMLKGKQKHARESVASSVADMELSCANDMFPELEELPLNPNKDYSEDSILYLLDLQNDGRKSVRGILSNRGRIGLPEDTVLERSKSKYRTSLTVQEALQDMSQPWTWNITSPSDWDFSGTITNTNAGLIRIDEGSAQLGDVVVAVQLKPSNIGKDFNFDTVAAVPLCNSKPLAVIGLSLMDDHFDLVRRLGLDPARLRNFLVEVEKGYRASNPYHNNTHAADVTQRFATLLTTCRLKVWALSDLEVLAGLIAAISHDFLHPGTNNAFQVAAGAPVAIMHNNKHVLENHSAMRGLLMLKGKDTDTNFLSSLPQTQRRQIRDIVIEMILATDMSEHFGVVSSFETKVLPKIQTSSEVRMLQGNWNALKSRISQVKKLPVVAEDSPSKSNEAEQLSSEERIILLRMALKCADIGHVTLPLKMHVLWVESLQEEFYRQGDQEQQLDSQISFLCDRRKPRNGPAHGENQLGFMDVIAFPLYAAWVKAFPSCEVLLENLKRNRRHWEVDAIRNTSQFMHAN